MTIQTNGSVHDETFSLMGRLVARKHNFDSGPADPPILIGNRLAFFAAIANVKCCSPSGRADQL